MFIARVSRGRTVREFITGVLLVPTAVAIVWMTGFGNSALHQEVYDEISSDPAAVEARFDYAPRTYPVQVLDPEHGLPMTADGEYMVSAGALLQESPGGGLVTVDGTPVTHLRGVLVNADTLNPYYPDEADTFTGEYLAEEKGVTIAGYLSEPVLNETRTDTIDTLATAMFFMLEAYPLVGLTAFIGTLSVILFFVTSSDSASMVADIIASGGKQTPAVGTRLFWGILEGILAAVLLVAGGLEALQTGSIAIGLPFTVVIILMCISLYRGLHRDFHGELPEEHIAHIHGEWPEDDEAAE
jgi:choline/glycine/proline betaine transport protein